MGASCAALQPLLRRLEAHVLAAERLHGDDTIVTVVAARPAPINKVYHVHTIGRVAEMRGQDEDWLWDVDNEIDQEDGLI